MKKEDWLKILNKEELKYLKNMSTQEIENTFNKELSFGTAGVRSLIGFGNSKLNKITVSKIAKGYLNFLIKNNFNKVVIAYDNRRMSKEFCNIIASILSDSQIEVYLFSDISPTPMLSYAINKVKANGGLMITASHNPKEYNGIKFYNEHGHQYLRKESQEIIELIKKIDINNFEENKKDENYIKYFDNKITDDYINQISNWIKTYFKNTPKIKVGYSSLHGCGTQIIRKLFTKNNINFQIEEKESKKDSEFSISKSPNPEEENAFYNIKKMANKHNLDLLLLTDPDADRFGVMIKNKDNYKMLSGNQIATLIIYFLTSKQSYDDKFVSTTIVSSDLPKIIARRNNIKVIENLVGFKFIGRDIVNDEKNFLFGFEESNGALINPISKDKDGIQIVLFLIYLFDYYKDISINNLFDKIQKEYGYFNNKTLSLTLNDNFSIINFKEEILRKIKNIEEIQDFSKQKVFNKDGKEIRKLDLKEENLYILKSGSQKIILRPSGTEPKMKIYLETNSNENKNNDIIDLEKDITNIFNYLI